jgi:hypothetical protein
MLLLNSLILSKVFVVNILGWPIKMMIEMGKPFKFSHADSAIPSHWDEGYLKQQFNKEQREHYTVLWIFSGIAIVATIAILALLIVTNGTILLLLVPVLALTLAIDGFMLLCRALFFIDTQKKQSKAGQALVPLDQFKDTSLEALVAETIKIRAEKVEKVRKWKEENPDRSIRHHYDVPDDVRRAYRDLNGY